MSNVNCACLTGKHCLVCSCRCRCFGFGWDNGSIWWPTVWTSKYCKDGLSSFQINVSKSCTYNAFHLIQQLSNLFRLFLSWLHNKGFGIGKSSLSRLKECLNVWPSVCSLRDRPFQLNTWQVMCYDKFYIVWVRNANQYPFFISFPQFQFFERCA